MRSSFGIHLMRYSTHLPTSYPKRFPKTRPPCWESRPLGSMTAPRVNVLHSRSCPAFAAAPHFPVRRPRAQTGAGATGGYTPGLRDRCGNRIRLACRSTTPGKGSPRARRGGCSSASTASTAPPTRREWIDTHICPCVLDLRTSPNGAW